MLVIVAETQTFFSHIHRNLKLTAVLGHNSEKTLSSCTTVLGDPVEQRFHGAASLAPGWMLAIGNRSATLSFDFKKRFPSGTWSRYIRQSPESELFPCEEVGRVLAYWACLGQVGQSIKRQSQGQANPFFLADDLLLISVCIIVQNN